MLQQHVIRDRTAPHAETRGRHRAAQATPPPQGLNSRFWKVACVLFGTCAIVKGLRVPGVWAKSQLQITYVHGFVKRGLLGEVLRLAHLRSAHAVSAFCFAELAVFLGLLALFTSRSGLLANRRNPALAAAFAGSYAITFLAHLVGYHDIVLYTLALAVVLVQNPRARIMLAIPVCIVALLIHEIFLLTALPPILFSFLADRECQAGHPTSFGGLQLRGSVARAGLLLGVCLVVALAVSFKPSLSSADLQSFKRETLADASYPVDDRVLDVVGASMTDNVRLNFRVIRTNLWWWAELGVAVLTLGPLIALMVFSASSLASGVQKAAFLGASFAPLLLNLLGWDNVRWVTLCALTTYINGGLLTRAAGSPLPLASNSLECRAAILVLGLGLASGHGLMDAQKVNPYPFFPPMVRPAVIRHDGLLGQIL